MAFSHLFEMVDYFSDERNQHRNTPVRTKNPQKLQNGKQTSGDYFSQLCDGTKQQEFLAKDFKYSSKKFTESADEKHKGARRLQVFNGSSAAERVRQRGRPFAYRKTPQALKLFLLMLAMGSLPAIHPSVLSHTICKFFEYKERCENDLKEAENNLNTTKTFCYGEFDNYMCWPYVEPGQVAKAPCPDFHRNVNDSNDGYRYCQENGSWYQHLDEWSQKPIVWRNIDDCIFFDNAENGTAADSFDVDESEATLLTNFRTMYTIGYGISLVCLVIALLLLTFFKKLHCTRNYIHMNLMVSFILRYVVILVKDSVLISHYKLDGLADFTSPHDITALRQYCDENNSAGWVLTRCRLVVTLMHYAITANYFWLLAEGLYLQMLLVFVMSENRYFAGFMVFGWGTPWVSVLIWVALRMHYENSGCWDMNDEMPIWWAIRAPIIISIVINFFIFINIIRMIVSKLKAHHMARTDMKMRLARSTLALIPLLGIHYIVFLVLTEEVTNTNATPLHLRLAFDMFLSSIQGTLVSVLYCFLNNEVQVEVKRAWNLWRSRANLPRGSSNFRKGSTTVSGNHSTQMTQFYSRHSATGGDLALQETSIQFPNSTRLGVDSRENSIVDANSLNNSDGTSAMNCNGILTDAKKKQMCQDQPNEKVIVTENNNVNTTISITSAKDDNETNGNVDCRDDIPFLEEHV